MGTVCQCAVTGALCDKQPVNNKPTYLKRIAGIDGEFNAGSAARLLKLLSNAVKRVSDTVGL